MKIKLQRIEQQSLLTFGSRYKRSLLAAGTVILLLGLGLYIKQQQESNLSSLNTGIKALESQINKLPLVTANSKVTITQKIANLEKQIQILPETLPAKKELNRQIADLQQEINAFPDNSIPSKDRLSLEKDLLSLEKELATARNAIWATLFQAVTAIFFALTAISTWLNFQAAQKKQITDAENARANLKATEEKQITERFSKAVELLGSEKIEVRLGGIYALERIAKDSPKDHWTIMEVLTSFIREKSPLQPEQKPRTEPLGQDNQTSQSNPQDNTLPKIATDVQAALTVIGRRNFKEDKGKINLRSTNLSQVDFRVAHLEGAILYEAHLKGAHLAEAHLKGADFRAACLEGAILVKAHLEGADLSRAHMEGAILRVAHLEGASLYEAHLEGSDLYNAHLEEAYLRQAHLEGARDLTVEQVKSARNWETAHYDDEFRKKLGL